MTDRVYDIRHDIWQIETTAKYDIVSIAPVLLLFDEFDQVPRKLFFFLANQSISNLHAHKRE